MAEGQRTHRVRETKTLVFARWIVKHRAGVSTFLILTTLFFLYPIFNLAMASFGHRLPGPMVRVDTRERDLWPDHPFIHAQDKFSAKFGSSSLVAIGVIVKEGTIFTPETIQKIDRITKRLDGEGYESHSDAREELRTKIEEANPDIKPTELLRELDREYPPYPVNHDQVRSVTHGSTRVTQIAPDGAIENDVLMKKVPKTQEDADKMREIVRQNPPVIYGRYVSWDEKGALITANFVTDRLSGREVYQSVFEHIQKIKAEEEDAGHQIYVTGGPILVGWVLKHAYEITLYVVLTVVATFALLWAYFRRWHGVFIPMVAATATVIWGLGYTGWRGITFDPLILVIPMLITARATSHTVQMAERFFEDYELMLPVYSDPELAKREVATVAMAELIVPGTLGILVDVAGLLVVMISSIPQMYYLGEFGAVWVTSILFTVEILHPILDLLPAGPEGARALPAPVHGAFPALHRLGRRRTPPGSTSWRARASPCSPSRPT